MASLALLCGLFFLAAACILLSWLSRLLHPELLNDAALSAGFSLASLGVAAVLRHDAARAVDFLWLLLLAR